jgi:hypothetical protein
LKLLATSCADSCERKKAIHTTMEVLATSCADSCERKKAQYTQHLETLKRNVLYQLMKYTKERIEVSQEN